LTNIDKSLYYLFPKPAHGARVAQFRFPDLQHREEAERNGSVRVGPSLARQPGFQAIYYGRTGELEAVSISLFEDRESADAAAITMNAQPLLDGQIPEMEAFGPMLERLPGLCQAYFLRTPDGATRIALTFWTSAKALAAGGAAVGSWQASEAAAGRPPAFTGTEASILTDLQVAIASVSSTMPVVA
jgi:heme-degrading monooxygenase HmoA